MPGTARGFAHPQGAARSPYLLEQTSETTDPERHFLEEGGKGLGSVQEWPQLGAGQAPTGGKAPTGAHLPGLGTCRLPSLSTRSRGGRGCPAPASTARKVGVLEERGHGSEHGTGVHGPGSVWGCWERAGAGAGAPLGAWEPGLWLGLSQRWGYAVLKGWRLYSQVPNVHPWPQQGAGEVQRKHELRKGDGTLGRKTPEEKGLGGQGKRTPREGSKPGVTTPPLLQAAQDPGTAGAQHRAAAVDPSPACTCAQHPRSAPHTSPAAAPLGLARLWEQGRVGMVLGSPSTVLCLHGLSPSEQGWESKARPTRSGLCTTKKGGKGRLRRWQPPTCCSPFARTLPWPGPG